MVQLLLHKRDLAWQVTRKWSLATLFGPQQTPRLAPLGEEELQLAALALFHEAIEQGRFTHGTFIEDRLEELIAEQPLGQQVPYTYAFEEAFAPALAGLDLLDVPDYLCLLCRGYSDDYPSFFQPELDGYQYLLDVLVRAQHQHLVPATPSLARAQRWLQTQLTAAAAPVAAPAAPIAAALVLATPVSAPAAAHAAPAANPVPRDHWAGILAQAPVHPQAEVEELLLTLALLEPGATGQLVPSADALPGGWVGAVHALQQAGYLIRNHEAVARVLYTLYGPVVSARALQRGVRTDNEVHLGGYQRAQAWLRQRAGA